MKQLFYTLLWLLGVGGVLSIWLVSAKDYLGIAPWFVVTWSQDWQTFSYWVLKFDDWSGHIFMLLDRNLWATTNDITSSESYWYFYQRWNNYWFASTWDILSWDYENNKVERQSEYDNHWYYWNIFINWLANYWSWAMYYNWLRWWSWNIASNGYWLSWITEDNIKNRQWPCPEWYHVPSAWEWGLLVKYWSDKFAPSLHVVSPSYSFVNDTYSNKFQQDFNIPFAGWRLYNQSRVENQGITAQLRSSSPTNSIEYYNLSLGTDSVVGNYYHSPGYGLSVRCFYDNYLFPYSFSFLNDGIEIESWSIISGERLIDVVDFNHLNITKERYEFNYRYIDWAESSWFDLTGDAITWNIVLYARWTPIEFMIDYELNGWVTSWDQKNITWYTIETNGITLINPIKTWYTFTWWSWTDIDWLSWNVVIPSGSTWNREYEANREINQYTITFDTVWGNTIDSITQNYNTNITPPSNPTRNGYRFVGRDKEIPVTMPAENITITAIWEVIKTSGGGWWWGWWSSKNTSKENTWAINTLSNINTWRIETWANINTWSNINIDDEEKIQKPSIDFSWYREWNQKEILSNWYTREFNNAYKFAYNNWITTMWTIEKAKMNSPLNRIAMAKMLSNYAINVLWKKPANKVVPKFPDVGSKLNEDYGWAVDLAYQLWIMWIWIDKFRPNDEVTRAEFGTALSRMLYGTADWDWAYYKPHLEVLKKLWIISNDNPDLKELRGYVMLMLMRSAM